MKESQNINNVHTETESDSNAQVVISQDVSTIGGEALVCSELVAYEEGMQIHPVHSDNTARTKCHEYQYHTTYCVFRY